MRREPAVRCGGCGAWCIVSAPCPTCRKRDLLAAIEAARWGKP